jgi:hypothetical protein
MKALMVAILLVATLAAGCGGDDDDYNSSYSYEECTVFAFEGVTYEYCCTYECHTHWDDDYHEFCRDYCECEGPNGEPCPPDTGWY